MFLLRVLYTQGSTIELIMPGTRPYARRGGRQKAASGRSLHTADRPLTLHRALGECDENTALELNRGEDPGPSPAETPAPSLRGCIHGVSRNLYPRFRPTPYLAPSAQRRIHPLELNRGEVPGPSPAGTPAPSLHGCIHGVSRNLYPRFRPTPYLAPSARR